MFSLKAASWRASISDWSLEPDADVSCWSSASMTAPASYSEGSTGKLALLSSSIILDICKQKFPNTIKESF